MVDETDENFVPTFVRSESSPGGGSQKQSTVPWIFKKRQPARNNHRSAGGFLCNAGSLFRRQEGRERAERREWNDVNGHHDIW